jgi:hypothetical protein
MISYIKLLCIVFTTFVIGQTSIDCLDNCSEEGASWGKADNEISCDAHQITTTTDFAHYDFFGTLDNVLYPHRQKFFKIQQPLYAERTGTTFIGTSSYPKASGSQTAYILRNPNSDMKNFEEIAFNNYSWAINMLELYTGSIVVSLFKFISWGSTLTSTTLKFSIDDGITWGNVAKTITWPQAMFRLGLTKRDDHVLGTGRHHSNQMYHMAYHSYDGGLSFTSSSVINYSGSNGARAWCSGLSVTDSGKIIVSCWSHPNEYGKPGGNGIHYSNDNGETWASVPGFLGKPSSITPLIKNGPYSGGYTLKVRSNNGVETSYVTYDELDTFQVIPQPGFYADDGNVYKTISSPSGSRTNIYKQKVGKVTISSDGGNTYTPYGNIVNGQYRAIYVFFYRGKQYLATTAYPNDALYGLDFGLPNDGDVKLVEIDYQKFNSNPNVSENACKNACDDLATCCLYIWNKDTNCCTLRTSGCYERNGIDLGQDNSPYDNMCTTNILDFNPSIKSVAKDCKNWCDNSSPVNICNNPNNPNNPITTSCNIKVPRNLQYIVSKSRLNKSTSLKKSCKINKPIIGAKKLAKKIYAQVIKTMRIPKRKSMSKEKRKRVRQRIYERFAQRFLAYNKKLGLKDVRILDIKIAAKLSRQRRRLLDINDGYDNVITYDINYNSTSEEEIQQVLEIIVNDDGNYTDIANALLADQIFMENENIFDANDIYTAEDDEQDTEGIQIVISEENEYDPNDSQWCQYRSTTF